MAVIAADGGYDELRQAAEAAHDGLFLPARRGDRFAAPYRRPRKIWGIGLNYVEHAADLAETAPDEPASFIKGDHTIIGPDEPHPGPARRASARPRRPSWGW